jgi:hypothetical protein
VLSVAVLQLQQLAMALSVLAVVRVLLRFSRRSLKKLRCGIVWGWSRWARWRYGRRLSNWQGMETWTLTLAALALVLVLVLLLLLSRGSACSSRVSRCWLQAHTARACWASLLLLIRHHHRPHQALVRNLPLRPNRSARGRRCDSSHSMLAALLQLVQRTVHWRSC